MIDVKPQLSLIAYGVYVFHFNEAYACDSHKFWLDFELVQKVVIKEQEHVKVQQASTAQRAVDDARRTLAKNLDAEQKYMRAEQIKRIKVIFLFEIHFNL